MPKLVNFRPVVLLAGGLALGITLGYFGLSDNTLGKILTILVAILFCAVLVFFSTEKLRPLLKTVFTVLFALAFSLGAFYFGGTVERYKKADVSGHTLTVTGRISSFTPLGGYATAVIDDVSVSGVYNGQSEYKIFAVIYGDTDADIGSEITFKGVLKDKTAFAEGKFAASQISEKIKYFIELGGNDIEITEVRMNPFTAVNKFIRDTLKSGMDGEEFAVAYAMLTGNSDYMSEQTLSGYRNAGVAHVFAVSGLHIGVLATAIYFLLKKMRINGKVAFFITLAACVFYAGVCGFSASSLRAVLMFAVLNVADIFGFKYDGVSSVFFAMLVILLISPVQLLCAGFQLSFSVVLTIVILLNPLKKLFKKLPEKIRSVFAITISAELGGIPVLLLNFGHFTVISAAVNIVFIPLAAVFYIFLLVSTLLGGAFSPTVFLFLPKNVIYGLNRAFGFFDFGIFVVGGLTVGGFVILYYLALVVASGLINLKKVVKFLLTLVLCLSFIAGTGIKTADVNNGVYATATGGKSFSAVLFSKGRENLLVVADVNHIFSVAKIKVAAAKTKGVTTVLFLDTGRKIDLQVAYTKLKNYFDVEYLLYCGEKEERSEYVLEKEYKALKTARLTDGDKVRFGDNEWYIYADGKCVAGRIGENSVAVTSDFGDGYYAYVGAIKESPDVIFTADRAARLYADYSPYITVSLRYSTEFPDAERENYLLRLDKSLK